MEGSGQAPALFPQATPARSYSSILSRLKHLLQPRGVALFLRTTPGDPGFLERYQGNSDAGRKTLAGGQPVIFSITPTPAYRWAPAATMDCPLLYLKREWSSQVSNPVLATSWLTCHNLNLPENLPR